MKDPQRNTMLTSRQSADVLWHCELRLRNILLHPHHSQTAWMDCRTSPSHEHPHLHRRDSHRSSDSPRQRQTTPPIRLYTDGMHHRHNRIRDPDMPEVRSCRSALLRPLRNHRWRVHDAAYPHGLAQQ